MPSPSATPTPVTPPRVPLIDPRTGLIDRAWYMFFVSLMNAAELVYEGDVGPNLESLIASYDAALQALAQNVETQPLPVDLSAELTKQIEAAGLANNASGLLSQIAEMQKQLDALNLLPPPAQIAEMQKQIDALDLLPPPSQGTVVAVTATAPVASSGGIAPDISLNAAYGDTLNPYAAKTANFVLSGPTSGAAAAPTFRALVAADIPVLPYVTSVSGTAGRITSTGGTTPVIDLASGVATPGTTGSSTLVPVITIDTYGRVTSITTAANPQGTVTSVAASVPSFLSIAGSPITTSGTLAVTLSGTALPTTSGGTGLTSFTANGVVYASSTSALATGTGLTFDGTNLIVGATSLPISGSRFGVSGASGVGAGVVSLVNTSAATKKWQTGPDANGNFVVFNDAATGVYITYGGVAWIASSDERLKDIIEPITDAANKVSTLRAVIGKFKTDADGTRRSFLIAQDVQAVLPEAVDASNPDKLGIQYTDVIPLLAAAIKEQQFLIQSLTARIAALEQK